MTRLSKINCVSGFFVTAVVFLLNSCAGEASLKNEFGDQVGINMLKPDIVTRIDSVTNHYRDKLYYARVGIVYDGNVAFTKSYVRKNVAGTGEWASISKPATALIVMRLVEQGYIESIDDNIWEYSEKYKNCLPGQYMNSNLTIRHFLTHQSGVLYAAPLWDHSTGKLILQFAPGDSSFYSSGGYGVIGDVIRSATGKSFKTLVEEYIGTPVGGTSITAREQIDSLYEETYSDWQSPASFISSTIEDMAKFSAGVMTNKYVPSDVMYNQVLKNYGKYGLGWWHYKEDGKIYSFHTGNNGRQKSVMINDMPDKISVSIQFSDSVDMTTDRVPWAKALIDLLESCHDPMLETNTEN